MLRFTAYLIERAATDAIVNLVKHGTVMPISSMRRDIQFILPSGQPIQLDSETVHAQAVYRTAKKKGLDIRLIDVLEAGIVRAASATAFQVGSAITSAQAQFMVDRAMFVGSTSLSVSIADADMARRIEAEYLEQKTEYLKNHPDEKDYQPYNAGDPIEIDDKDSRTFDLERAKSTAIRSWTNNHYNH